jgi:hypothetical protein
MDVFCKLAGAGDKPVFSPTAQIDMRKLDAGAEAEGKTLRQTAQGHGSTSAQHAYWWLVLTMPAFCFAAVDWRLTLDAPSGQVLQNAYSAHKSAKKLG